MSKKHKDKGKGKGKGKHENHDNKGKHGAGPGSGASSVAGEDGQEGHFEDTPFPYDEKLERKQYEKALLALQIELRKLQVWVQEQGERLLIIFEGRDAAGKGGTIQRFRQHLNPRHAPHVALAKPTDYEKGQWYFQRYIAHLPSRGDICFFDRSWYNRAGVEPVLGFCTAGEYRQFMNQVPNMERGLTDAGIRIIKLWFAVSREEQTRRLDARESDPLKRWKLSPTDRISAKKWDEYTVARDRMFYVSHTTWAPWTVIRSDCKKRARLNAIRHVLHGLPYAEKDPEVATAPDPLIVGSAQALMPRDEDFDMLSLRRRE